MSSYSLNVDVRKIQQAMKEMSFNPISLARMAGVSRATVFHALKAGRCSTGTLLKLADALYLPPKSLIRKVPTVQRNGEAEAARDADATKRENAGGGERDIAEDAVRENAGGGERDIAEDAVWENAGDGERDIDRAAEWEIARAGLDSLKSIQSAAFGATTLAECICIYEHSFLTGGQFTKAQLAAAYVLGLSGLYALQIMGESKAGPLDAHETTDEKERKNPD